MKRANNLLNRIETKENLRWAFWKASKGKRYAKSVLEYQNNLEANLSRLQTEIRSCKVDIGDYRYFNIYEPKKREICASAFREQVLHHALINVCHDTFEKKQIFDSYASRKGKGTFAAVNRAQKYAKKYKWYLKLDVKKFFASIHHDVLKNQLSQLFKERGLLSIFFQLIDSYNDTTDRGLPIGNLTSQYLANHYLAGLDHYIKEHLSCKAYVRYMDDMIIMGNSKEELLVVNDKINQYCTEILKVQLKPIQLNRLSSGMPFLGFKIYPFYRRLLQKSKQRYIKKVKRIYLKKKCLSWTEQQCEQKYLPLESFINHSSVKKFKRKVYLHLEDNHHKAIIV